MQFRSLAHNVCRYKTVGIGKRNLSISEIITSTKQFLNTAEYPTVL